MRLRRYLNGTIGWERAHFGCRRRSRVGGKMRLGLPINQRATERDPAMSDGVLPANLSDRAVTNLRAGRTAAGIVTGVRTPGDLRVGNSAVVVVD